MTVLPNSLAAYGTVDLSRGQAAVLKAVCALHEAGRHPCDQDIAKRLSWPINRVTPRRLELQSLGTIYMAGHRIGPMGRRVAHWAPEPRQLTFWRQLHPRIKYEGKHTEFVDPK